MSEKITLFDRFGGTRKMAEDLGEAPSTVQSWKSAGRIPAAHQPKVLAKAEELGLAITAEDVVFPMGLSPTANVSGEADSPGPFSKTSSSTLEPSDLSASETPAPSGEGPVSSNSLSSSSAEAA